MERLIKAFRQTLTCFASLLFLSIGAFAQTYPSPTFQDVRIIAIKTPINGALYLTSSGDQTANLARAQTDLLSVNPNGGTILLPTGTIRLCAFSLKTGVVLQGEGPYGTAITQSNGCNSAAIQSDAFTTFTGTNFCFDNGAGVTVPNNFGLKDLSIFGNSANNTSGRPLRIYGWGYTIDNVYIFDPTATGGFSSEFSSSACGSPTDRSLRLEASIKNFGVIGNLAQNSGTNILWNGPHDSQWVNVVSGYGGTGVHNIHVGTKGFGLQISNAHAWSAVADYNWYLESSLTCTNCIGDSAGATSGWLIGANGITITGGQTYSQAASGASSCFQIGDASHLNVSQVNIKTYTVSCVGSGGTFNFVSDGGNSTIETVSYQASGSWYTGTPSTSTTLIANLSGGASCYPSGPANCSGINRYTFPLLVGTSLTPSVSTGYGTSGVGGVSGGYFYGKVGETEYGRLIISSASTALVTLAAVPVVICPDNLCLYSFDSDGTLGVLGTTSGKISLRQQAASGTYNWNWPTTAGTAGDVLTSQGGGATAMTWTTLATVATSGSASDLTTGTLSRSRGGTGQDLSAISGVKVSVANVAALKAITPSSAYYLIETRGYYTDGDGGGNTFFAAYGQPAGTYTDNLGTVLRPSGGDGSTAWLATGHGPWHSKQFGAKGDGVCVPGSIVMNNGSTQIVASNASFTDNDIGKTIQVPIAGASGQQLTTTIASRTNGTTINTADANASGSNINTAIYQLCYGSDDSEPLQSLVTVYAGAYGAVVIDPGWYLTPQYSLTPSSNTSLTAPSWRSSWLISTHPTGTVTMPDGFTCQNVVFQTDYRTDGWSFYANNTSFHNIHTCDVLGGDFWTTSSGALKITGSTWHTLLISDWTVDYGGATNPGVDIEGANQYTDVHLNGAFIDSNNATTGGSIYLKNTTGVYIKQPGPIRTSATGYGIKTEQTITTGAGLYEVAAELDGVNLQFPGAPSGGNASIVVGDHSQVLLFNSPHFDSYVVGATDAHLTDFIGNCSGEYAPGVNCSGSPTAGFTTYCGKVTAC